MDTNGHEWTRMNVAGAFRPEICRGASRGDSPDATLVFAGAGAHAKPRSREGKGIATDVFFATD